MVKKQLLQLLWVQLRSKKAIRNVLKTAVARGCLHLIKYIFVIQPDPTTDKRF